MTAQPRWLTLQNAVAVRRNEIPDLDWVEIRQGVLSGTAAGWQVVAMFGHLPENEAAVEIYVIMADREGGHLHAARTRMQDETFPSLTPECAQVHLFEREIAEQFGLRPKGHPWLKPVRFVKSWRPGHDAWGRAADVKPGIGVTDYYRVEGEEIHEVAVGPIHAGVIEPGHFRFQCHGEHVFHLEISLGYQHRGVERALVGGPDKRTVHYMETLAGDTTIGHVTAYCQAVEALAGCRVPARAQVLRGVALELERLANHTGDLGALAGDIGFLPTASYCGRLRGDFLNLSAGLCGSRFGRGLVRPGGVAFDVDDVRAALLLTSLEKALRDVTNAVNLLWARRRGPVARSRTYATTSLPVYIAFRTSRFPRPTRVMCSHAPTCAGWRSSVLPTSCVSNCRCWPVAPRKREPPNWPPTVSWCLWWKAGVVGSATWS
jgi:hypothetical protein